MLDLGSVISLERVHHALEDARRQQLTTWNALLATLVSHARKGRNGCGTLRALLDRHYAEVALTDSEFERLVVSFLRQAGLPPPTLQHEVSLNGRRYRLDLAYPDKKLGIELDGSYHLEKDVWEADHARRNAFALAGWTILGFTWRDYQRRRTHLVREIRSALA